MPSVSASPWFCCLHSRPNAKSRLLCFPWCGGGTQFYARWGADFGEDIEVIGIRLPGRETRNNEPFQCDLAKVTKLLGDEILKHYGDKPFAFFGHSLGCVLAVETATYMKQKLSKEPEHLFVSSDYAPHSKERKANIEADGSTALHEWSDDQLLERIKGHGGTPATVFENTEFMKKVFLPAYKADLQLVHNYYRSYKGKKPLTCGITAFDGDRDASHHLREYADITTGRFLQVLLPGRHFYLLKEDNSRRVRDVITRAVSPAKK